MQTSLQNLIFVFSFSLFVVFIPLPKNMIVQSRTIEEHSEELQDAISSLCNYRLKCKFQSRECEIYSRNADNACEIFQDCISVSIPGTCYGNSSRYFISHSLQQQNTSDYPQSDSLNECLALCLEIYGCSKVKIYRYGECTYEFDADRDLKPGNEYDVYTLRKSEEFRTCANNDYVCSPRSCVDERLVCNGYEDCVNGRDEMGCSIMFGILTDVVFGQDEFKYYREEEGISLEGCAKLCLEQEKRCSSFSYMMEDPRCRLGCTECDNMTSVTVSDGWYQFTVAPLGDVGEDMEVLTYLSKIGKLSSLKEQRILSHFEGQRGRIIKPELATTYSVLAIHEVACAENCLEVDGCRGFAFNHLSLKCQLYPDLDMPKEEVNGDVLYTLREHGNGICEDGEYHCSAGQCISSSWVCDKEMDCSSSKDEASCGAIQNYQEIRDYCVVTEEEEEGERRKWTVTEEICAKLCYDEAPHCRFFSYYRLSQLCVLGCPPESDCGTTNKLIQKVNCSLYYRKDLAVNSTNYRELVENSSYTECERVQYYGTYQSEPYIPINYNEDETWHLDDDVLCNDNTAMCSLSNMCIRSSFICDGFVDCSSGKDEHKCDTSLCFFSLTIGRKFITRKSKIWPNVNLKGCAKVCIEMDGCLAFAHNEKMQKMCWLYFEVPEQQVKDSNYDLYFLKNADRDVCPNYTFKCSHAQCIPQKAECDGKEDCNNGKDEENCDSESKQMLVSQEPELQEITENCGVRNVSFNPSQNSSFITQRKTGLRGVETPRGAYPWQAQIVEQNGTARRHLCGGTILSTHHILTAAHCLLNTARPDMLVIGGQHDTRNFDEGEQVFRVQNVYIHNNYSRVTYDNDIGLVRVKSEIQFSRYVQPACLPRQDAPYEPHTFCHVSGWGKVDVKEPNNPDTTAQVLRASVVPLVPDTDCHNYEVFQSHSFHNKSGVVCAGYVRGEPDSCLGDSGGPLACQVQERFTVMGFVSFGEKCGEPLYPGVYVRVSRYVDWIQQHMNL